MQRLAVDAASKHSPDGRKRPAERAPVFLKAAEIVKRRRSEIAEVLARETGHDFIRDIPTGTCRRDPSQVAGWCSPKAGAGDQSPGNAFVGVRRPLGVVAKL